MNNTTAYWCKKYRAIIADAKAKNISNIAMTREELNRYLPCMKSPEVSTSTSVLGGTVKQLDDSLLAQAVVLMVAAIVGILGNSAVIAFYLKRLRTLHPWKVLILHLACCDFLFAGMQILLALPSLTNQIGYLYWGYGVPLCKIVRAAHALGSMIAVQNILIIAVERYKGIINLLSHQTNAKKRIQMALLGSWVFGLASCVPIVIVADINAEKGGACDEIFSRKKYEFAWGIYLLVIFGVLPFTALAYLYGRIIMHLRQSSKKTNAIFLNLTQEQISQRHVSEMRTIKMLIMVVLLFFLCVLPTRITTVIMSLTNVEKLPLDKFSALVFCGNLTYPLHVAVNPIVYAFMDREFRNALVFKCNREETFELSTKKVDSNTRDPENTSLTRFENPGNSSF